jgi:hypothetical protein
MFHVGGEGGHDAIESDGFILQGERQVEQVAAVAALVDSPELRTEQLVEPRGASPWPFMDTSPESRYISKKSKGRGCRSGQLLDNSKSP